MAQPSYDVIIVGAGPAGLSAAARAHHYKLNYLVLEQGTLANTLATQYQRGKFVMAGCRAILYVCALFESLMQCGESRQQSRPRGRGARRPRVVASSGGFRGLRMAPSACPPGGAARHHRSALALCEPVCHQVSPGL